MKTIAMTLPLAASLLFATAAEAATPRAELLAGTAHTEVVLEVRHDRGSRHGRGHDYGHDTGYGRGDYRRGHSDDRGHYDNRGHYDKGGRRDGREYRQARRYAAEAVDQAREARRLGLHPDHPRWSLSFDRHFNWALGMSNQALHREHYRRAAQLREWRRQAAWYGHNRSGYRHPY